MASLRNLRFTAIGLSLFALLSARAAWADCPTGSGIDFPFLSASELECQRHTFLGTLDYFDSFLAARQDCFSKELNGVYKPGVLDCLFPITNDQPGTTGDPDTDRRLRAAEAALTRRILIHCTNVNLQTIGFPGFCDDATPLTPYDAFDHNQCMLKRAKKLGTFILDTEHPPFPGHLSSAETYCQDHVARLSS